MNSATQELGIIITTQVRAAVSHSPHWRLEPLHEEQMSQQVYKGEGFKTGKPDLRLLLWAAKETL